MILITVRTLLVAAFLAAWEGLIAAGYGSQLFFGRPSGIGEVLWEFLIDPSFWSQHVWTTAQEILLGLAVGTGGGLIVAFVLGKYESMFLLFSPILQSLYVLPRIALAPLFILWFGIGVASKIALVVSLVFFIVFYNAYAGIKQVDVELIEVVRTMDPSEWFIWRHVIVPSAMPFIFAGFRTAVAFGMMGAIAAEMISSQLGLGNVIAHAAGQFNTDRTFATLVIIALFAILLYRSVDIIEHRLLRWQPPAERSVETGL